MKAECSPFPYSETKGIFGRHVWSASWIGLAGVDAPPYVLAFRLTVEQAEAGTVRCFVTADERYELYLDGVLVARGPERGLADAWYYATLDLLLGAGSHVLVARIWALGDKAPVAQISVLPGFLLGVEDGEGGADARWCTGLAPWDVKRVEGYQWLDHPDIGFDGFTGKKVFIDGAAYPWGVERGEGDGWTPAVVVGKAAVFHPTDLRPVRLLVPGTLPPMMSRRYEGHAKVRFVEDVSGVEKLSTRPVEMKNHLAIPAGEVEAWLGGRSELHVPARTRWRAIVDLETYLCAYPHVVATGGKGARLTLRWAEALYEMPALRKGNRNEIEGRIFRGFGDIVGLNGLNLLDRLKKSHFSTLWWQAGRYLELLIETAEEELVLPEFWLEETRYPLESESAFAASDERLDQLAPLLLRTLQVNAHETFMDCPYYEQLNYTGDTLLDCLTVYAISRDRRLARKSIELFDRSRLTMGLTQSRVPSRVRQVIPPFSLLWISMVRNHAWWCGEPDFIRTILPGVRAVLDAHLLQVGANDLLPSLRGWNFLDWKKEWTDGVPPGGDFGGVSGPLNWLFVYVLQAAVELETYAGEPELAARYSRWADRVARATEGAFWTEERGLFADDLGHRSFSEHAQCLAILGGRARKKLTISAAQSLLQTPGLIRCTYYFSHYLFETLRQIQQPALLLERLQEWYGLPAQGFVTTPETSEPSRSDCHAWGAHPLFHFYATILGIRPAAPGFSRVEVRPQLGPLKKMSGRMVHPKGWIEIEVERNDEAIMGTVTLPAGVTGEFEGVVSRQPLVPGRQKVCG